MAASPLRPADGSPRGSATLVQLAQALEIGAALSPPRTPSSDLGVDTANPNKIATSLPSAPFDRERAARFRTIYQEELAAILRTRDAVIHGDPLPTPTQVRSATAMARQLLEVLTAEGLEQYAGQWVALRNNKVIDHDSRLDVVLRRLGENGQHADLVMEIKHAVREQ